MDGQKEEEKDIPFEDKDLKKSNSIVKDKPKKAIILCHGTPRTLLGLLNNKQGMEII